MYTDREQIIEAHLACYATRATSGGRRVYPEEPDSLRSPFEVDRFRIIESAAFRRMEQKTQVFVATGHDHFRTRMTHTLEVADIARCLATGLLANEQLSEAVSLAHDLGHPPFGHAGETALDQAMSDYGGFNHNAHSLRVVEFLEHPFPSFRGLNLTLATLAGLGRHQTRYDRPAGGADSCAGDEIEIASTSRMPSVEAQIVSLADRIAYNCHDLEDAIGAELVRFEELSELTLWREARNRSDNIQSDLHIAAVRRTILNEMIKTVLTDVMDTFRRRQETCHDATSTTPGPTIGKPVPAMDESMHAPARSLRVPVAPSAAIESQCEELEGFLNDRVYRHPDIARMDEQGRGTVAALFDLYKSQPCELPERYSRRIDGQGLERVICDYVAGMTDRFCRQEYDRLARPH